MSLLPKSRLLPSQMIVTVVTVICGREGTVNWRRRYCTYVRNQARDWQRSLVCRTVSRTLVLGISCQTNHLFSTDEMDLSCVVVSSRAANMPFMNNGLAKLVLPLVQ